MHRDGDCAGVRGDPLPDPVRCDPDDLDRRARWLDTVHAVADACRAAILSAVDAGVEPGTKPDGSVVTNADVEAERAARAVIAERMPEAGVIGEELGALRPDAELVWVLDPIDGTAEFVRGIVTYGCIVGLRRDGRPEAGAFDHPALDLRLAGARGLGVRLNGAPVQRAAGSGRPRIGLPSPSSFRRRGDERHRYDRVVARFPDVRVYHTCYSHLCVATGALDAGVEWRVREWDLAATQVLVEEAGGAYRAIEDRTLADRSSVHSAVYGDPEIVDTLVALLAG